MRRKPTGVRPVIAPPAKHDSLVLTVSLTEHAEQVRVEAHLMQASSMQEVSTCSPLTSNVQAQCYSLNSPGAKELGHLHTGPMDRARGLSVPGVCI